MSRELLSRIFGLAPAGLLAEVDAEDRLPDDLVDEQGIRGMEAAAARVAVEALELIRLEHARAARDGHGEVDHFLGRLDGIVLGRYELHGPLGAVVHAGRPL